MAAQPTLTQEQADALRRFAEAHGRTWKASLRAAWESGTYYYVTPDEQALLQQVRNELGPYWLVGFRLTATHRAEGGRA